MSQKIKTSVDIDGSLTTNEFGVSTGHIRLDTTPTNTPTSEGTMSWNSVDGTTDIKLKGGNVTLQVGQEQVKRVVNKVGSDLLEGNYQVVRSRLVSEGGASGQRLAVVLAQADSDLHSATTIGVVTETIPNNQEGFINTSGEVHEINTTGSLQGETWSDGDILYLSPTTAGRLTNIKPVAPQHLVVIGQVVYSHAVHGKIDINVQNGYELDELHDVLISGVSGNDFLVYEGAPSYLWRNKSISTVLGYTPANNANVVHLTGNEDITGIKYFNYLYDTEDYSTRLNYYYDDGFIRSNVIPISIINNNTSDVVFSADETGVTANSFVKIGGTSDQYLKADGSVSTALNSRIEVNFIATSGQTTFSTTYEVGQVDVYYNGSKLYPDEFTATNGTTIVLATAATLNAQISVVKYVSAFSTTAVRNETTFTTTAGQTTFSVSYTIGQLDVFYNGSKLSSSEFTANNGTSVVLGFSCAVGESIVIVSYVNQVSGASGTINYLSKFTGGASLGNSQIYDNGTNIGIATTTLSEKLNLDGNMLLRSAGAIKFNRSDNAVSTNLYDAGTYFVLDNRNANGFAFQATGANIMNLTASGLLGVGTGLSGSARVNILNVASAPFLALRSTNNIYEIAKMSFDQSSDILSIVNNQGASTSGIAFGTVGTERMRINSSGDVAIGTTNPLSGGGNAKWLTLNGSSYGGGIISSLNGVAKFYNYYDNAVNCAVLQGTSGVGVSLWSSDVERIRITSGGETYIQAGTGYQIKIQPNCQINSTLNGGGASMYLNFQGNGAIYAGSSYAVLYAGSDRRIKTDIKDAESTLDKILNLTPRTFRYKERSNDVSYGFIAQEVEEIMPEIVKTSEGISNCAGEEIVDQKSIESYGLAWASILVKAMQEQQAQIKELQDELVLLKNK